MRFIQPELLVGLLAVPLVALGWAWLRRRGRSRTEAAGALARPEASGPGRRRLVPITLQLIALTLLLTAFARPEADIDLPRVEGTAILAFDVSNSMLAEDLELGLAAFFGSVRQRPPDVPAGRHANRQVAGAGAGGQPASVAVTRRLRGRSITGNCAIRSRRWTCFRRTALPPCMKRRCEPWRNWV